MTKAAKHYGKRPAHFLELPGSREYMDALAEALNVGKSDLWVSTRGRYGATFIHPKMAVFFARWLDVRFAVWCDLMIDNILRGNIQTTVVVPTQEAMAVQEERAKSDLGGRPSQPLQIRVVTLEGNPWFVAKDVLEALDLKGFASQHTKRLDSGELMVVTRDSHTPNMSDFSSLFTSKAPSHSLVSESGLYKLIMRSDKPQAKEFQDMVTKEILPSIRKTGAYVVGQPSLRENPQMDPLDILEAQALLLPKLAVFFARIVFTRRASRNTESDCELFIINMLHNKNNL